MTSEDILAYYERLVEADVKKLNAFPLGLKDRAYFEQGIFHHRVILYMLRVKADIPVCHGAADCLNTPASKCKSGEHAICRTHAEQCYLCEAK
jgi:hypothetical protein